MYYFKLFTCDKADDIVGEMSAWVSKIPNIIICSVTMTKGTMVHYAILVTYKLRAGR